MVTLINHEEVDLQRMLHIVLKKYIIARQVTFNFREESTMNTCSEICLTHIRLLVPPRVSKRCSMAFTTAAELHHRKEQPSLKAFSTC
jgi:hypothetical protein